MRILAVDLGLARTGLAVCDKSEFLASPLTTINERNLEKLPSLIADKAKENEVELIVVGHPKNMDGSCGESARRAETFAENLREISGLPVELWDERMTTVTATTFLNEANVRGKQRKAAVDAVAATVILQNYLDYRKNHKSS